jgi:uncharacterized lipoprotein YbaY
MIDRPTEATLTLTLPDGSQRTVPAGTLPSDVVKSIGERLLQAAIAFVFTIDREPLALQKLAQQRAKFCIIIYQEEVHG